MRLPLTPEKALIMPINVHFLTALNNSLHFYLLQIPWGTVYVFDLGGCFLGTGCPTPLSFPPWNPLRTTPWWLAELKCHPPPPLASHCIRFVLFAAFLTMCRNIYVVIYTSTCIIFKYIFIYIYKYI